jgi:Fe-S-cluster containining protein
VKLGLQAAAARLQALDAAEPFPAMACPFLDDGRCRVYALRPVPCAGYHSLQRGACQTRYETRGGRVGIPVSRALQHSSVTLYEEAGHALAELGLAARRVELVTAVNALLQRPELADHWLTGGEWPRDARGLVRGT